MSFSYQEQPRRVTLRAWEGSVWPADGRAGQTWSTKVALRRAVRAALLAMRYGYWPSHWRSTLSLFHGMCGMP